MARPALAYERLQCKAVGQEVVKLKTPWRDVITHLVALPLEFMQLSIDWLVCGGQLHWFYVCSGWERARHTFKLGGWQQALASAD